MNLRVVFHEQRSPFELAGKKVEPSSTHRHWHEQVEGMDGEVLVLEDGRDVPEEIDETKREEETRHHGEPVAFVEFREL